MPSFQPPTESTLKKNHQHPRPFQAPLISHPGVKGSGPTGPFGGFKSGKKFWATERGPSGARIQRNRVVFGEFIYKTNMIVPSRNKVLFRSIHCINVSKKECGHQKCVCTQLGRPQEERARLGEPRSASVAFPRGKRDNWDRNSGTGPVLTV